MREYAIIILVFIVALLTTLNIILYRRDRKSRRALKHVIIVDEDFGKSVSTLSRDFDVEIGDIMFTGVLLVRHALEAQNISMSRGDQCFTLNVKPVGGKIDITLKSSSRDKR